MENTILSTTGHGVAGFPVLSWLAVSMVVLGQMGEDAILAVPAALVSVCLGHLAERPETLAVGWWKKVGLLVGSVCLALVAGVLARQNAETANVVVWVVIMTALFAQDVFMMLVARKAKLLAKFNRGKKDTWR